MKIISCVYKAEIGCRLDLDTIYKKTHCVILKRTPFKNLHWNLKRIGGSCLLYESGNAFFYNTEEGTTFIRKYCRLLQKMGFPVRPKFHLTTKTATHKLKEDVLLPILHQHFQNSQLQSTLEMELFPALALKTNGLHFNVFASGKVTILGLNTNDDEMEACSILLDMDVVMNDYYTAQNALSSDNIIKS